MDKHTLRFHQARFEKNPQNSELEFERFTLNAGRKDEFQYDDFETQCIWSGYQDAAKDAQADILAEREDCLFAAVQILHQHGNPVIAKEIILAASSKAGMRRASIRGGTPECKATFRWIVDEVLP